MEILNAYIPMDRRQALARHEALPERAHGTALFTDISGFTPLTAVLAEELGPQRGAEALTHHLNTIYGALIDIVHQYRGSVVHFSGDAITCWFDEDDGQRGVAAAYDMQQAIIELEAVITPSGKRISLGIKTAVAAGIVSRFLVGDSQTNYIDVLAGALLDKLVAIERSLSRGEIGIDMSVVTVVEENSRRIIYQKTKEGDSFCLLASPPRNLPAQTWPAHEPISAEIAGQWLFPSVLEQLERGQAEFLAELRPVVALFISFSGINYDDDADARNKLHAFIQRVQIILMRFGGQLLELTIGDKGSYIYAVFGALQAHKDDVDRAINTASALIKTREEFEYIQDLQIGISQGRMHTGAYGSSSRRTYGVQGMDVNLAARLMTQAEPGQILVSKHLAEASQSSQHIFQELGDLHLRGFSKPMATYLVLDHEPEPGMETAVSGDIVGRDTERFLFNQYLFALRKGESNLVLVEGDAGIGKSYLISDFLTTAKVRNCIYLFGAGDAIGQATPYHAWRGVIHRLLGVPMDVVSLNDDGKHRLQRQILARLRHLDPELVSFAPLLNIFLPLDFPEDAIIAQMGEVARSDNIHDLVIRLLQETAVSTPLLLVIEDAQWIDSASSSLLGLVQRTVSPLLIVVTTRPQPIPLPVGYSRLLEHPDTYHLVLGTLPEEAVYNLVCTRLGVKALPQPVTKLIDEKAEGHPFFTEELAYALRDAQIIEVEDGVCRLLTDENQLTTLKFPDTIQGVIINRLDQLSPQQQITLKVASVIGRLFAFNILEDVYPEQENRQSLKENMLELDQLQLTQQESPEPNLAYIFKHIITQEVTYNLMTFAQRQQLHQRTAEVYETYYQKDLISVYELLAYHWSKAEMTEKALFYLEKAGEYAAKNAADEETIYFFTKALEIDEQAGFICKKNRRARWCLLAGEAYVNWSQYDKGQQYLKEGLLLLNKPKPSGAAIKTVSKLIHQILKQTHYRTRPSYYENKSEAEREVLLAASRAYSRLVEVDYHLGDLAGSIFDSFYALNLAEAAGPSGELAEAAAPVGIFWSIIPWRSRAEFYLDRALQVAEEAEDNDAISYALMVKGTYSAGIGHWSETQALYERMIALNKQFASRRLNDGYHHLSRAYYLQGCYQDSMKTAVSLINSAQKLNDQRFEAYGIQCQAYSLLYQGQLHEAVADLETLYHLFNGEDKIHDEQMELDTYGLLALVHLRMGNQEDAFRFAVLAQELASPFPSGYYNLPGYANPVEVYLALWAQDYAEPTLEKRFKQAFKLLKSYARIFTIGKPRFYLLQGLFAWQKGKERKAGKSWQKGLVVAETLKMPYEQGCLHYEIGHHAYDLAERDHHLKQAQTIFEALGARYELNRLKSD